jgi:hypothetical protein
LPHFFLAFLASLGLFVVNYARIGVRTFIWFFIALILMMIVGLLAAASTNGDAGDSIRATFNFIYDIFTGVGVFFGLIRMGGQRIKRAFLTVLVVVLLGSALEVAGPLKPVSDNVRSIFIRTNKYDLDQRDTENYGGIRPKFFASEPSYLGVSIAISFYLWFSSLARPRGKHYLQAALLLALGLYLVRSPVIVFGVFAWALTVCVTRRRRGGWKDSFYRFVPPAYAVFATLAPPVLLGLVLASWIPGYMQTGSFFARMIAPFYIAQNVLTSNPLFGIGLGNDDALNTAAFGAYSATGKLAETGVQDWTTLGSTSCSATWITLTSFGICGMVILALLIRALLKTLKVPVSFAAVSLVACFTFWLTFGRVNSPVAWATFFAVAAMCKLRLDERTARTKDLVSHGLTVK